MMKKDKYSKKLNKLKKKLEIKKCPLCLEYPSIKKWNRIAGEINKLIADEINKLAKGLK